MKKVLKVTFIGNTPQEMNDPAEICNVLQKAIAGYDFCTCYLALTTGFADICNLAVSLARSPNYGDNIESVLVLPECNRLRLEELQFLLRVYDIQYNIPLGDINRIVTPKLENLSPQQAVLRCAQWAIDRADLVISSVLIKDDPANQALLYAQQRCKKIIYMPLEEEYDLPVYL